MLIDSDDALTRAHLHAIELLLAEIIAERLSRQADPAASATSILAKLMTTAEHMPLSNTPAGEAARIRDNIKFTVFDVLNAALNLPPAEPHVSMRHPPALRPV